MFCCSSCSRPLLPPQRFFVLIDFTRAHYLQPTAKVIFGEDYHSDHSFQEFPASYSFLRATNEVSPYGTNNTQFANTIHAYEDLSPLMKELIDGLMVSHSATRAYGDADDDAGKGAHKVNACES